MKKSTAQRIVSNLIHLGSIAVDEEFGKGVDTKHKPLLQLAVFAISTIAGHLAVKKLQEDSADKACEALKQAIHEDKLATEE